MSPRYRAVKGTRDLLPPESEKYAAVEAIAREVFSGYGYGEIRTPVLESTELFTRSVGESTDIVHKEMYTFSDRKGRSLTMRPENTAGVVRALIEKGAQELPKPLRLWYAGPQFRYEQPQAGRYREFQQIGAELIGAPTAEGDAEVLWMLFAFLRRLGFDSLRARINCVPTGTARERFASAMREYLRPHFERLGPDDRRRVEQNPLRLFDSKDPQVQDILGGAPRTLDFLDEMSRSRHGELKRLLPLGGVDAEEDASIVRGLDYYTGTVFEVSAGGLGAQDAILGGGRYDELFTDLGGPGIAAVGFAIGEDRLVKAAPNDPRVPRDVYFVVPDARASFPYALEVSEEIRAVLPSAVVETDLSGKGLVKGLARAAQFLEDPSTFAFRIVGMRAVLLGSRERESEAVTVKNLRTGAQESFPRGELHDRLARSRG